MIRRCSRSPQRLDRIEKQTASMLPTGSVAPLVKAATQDRNETVAAKSTPALDAPKRPTLITELGGARRL